VYESCIELTLPLEDGIGDSIAHLFAFHVAASLRGGGRLVDVRGGELGIAGLFGGVGRQEHGDVDDEHGRENCPTLAGIAYHAAEGVAERRRDGEDGQQLEQIAQRGGIFERMGGIHAEESAPIGAELLDGHLGGGRSQGNVLLTPFAGRCGGVRRNCLHHALRNQCQRQHRRQGQQDIERDARDIDPKVADGVRPGTGQTANQRGQDGDSGRGGEKVLHGESRRLREVGKGRLAAVRLPVGVRSETDGRVEGEIGQNGREALRVEREEVLAAQREIQHSQPQRVEQQQRAGIHLPGHFRGGIDSGQPVQGTFGFGEPTVLSRPVAGEDLGHEPTQRFHQGQEQAEKQGDLRHGVGCHENHSGLSSATQR
jgi:hypothetical protein